jgi:cytochrome P450
MEPQETLYPAPEEQENPFPTFARLRREEPIRQVPGHGHYLVTRYEDVAHVFRHPEVFSSERAYSALQTFNTLGAQTAGETDVPSNLMETDPPRNEAQRQLCFRPFTPGKLKGYEDHIRAIADELIDGFVDRGSCDFSKEFARPLPTFVTSDIMGLPRSRRELLEQWGSLEVGVVYLSPERVEWQQRVSLEVAAFLEEEVRARYENPREDALTLIVQGQVKRDGELNLPYLMSELSVVIAGGVITTAHLMASSMALLCENPEQMALVREDYSRLPGMLEEAMRLESPAQWLVRRAVVDTELSGVKIPADSILLTLVTSANRDDARFDDPDRFDVGRANAKDHLAFGLGPHFCLGAPLARLETRIAWERLLTRLGEIELSEESDLSHKASPNFRAPNRVCINFTAKEEG